MEKSHLCVCPSLLLTILNFSVRGPTVTWYFNVSSPFSRKDKKDREKRLIKKWCTISLLDIDFKMLSKSLAAHPKKVLPSLVTHRQTVYVQIRCISKSGRLIYCVLQITDTLNLSRNLTFQKMFFICFNDSFSKLMKNYFYFILKALFVLKIFKFLSGLFEHVEKTA